MKKIIFTQNQLDYIYDAYYCDHLSTIKIGQKLGASYGVITRVFKENNWPLRKNYDYRRYSLDENYFDEINTHNKAYILGLFYADGYNDEKTGEVRLKLQDIDKQILLDINKEIGSDRPLRLVKNSDVNPNWRDAYSLNINSKHMSKKLSAYGMFQCKSLILDFPYWMDEELIPSFLRGYIDGDGWIQKYRIGFMSSDKFCHGTRDYLQQCLNIECTVMDMNRHYSNHTKTLYICNKNNLQPLAEALYKYGDLYIQRKYDSCIKFKHLIINKPTVA